MRTGPNPLGLAARFWPKVNKDGPTQPHMGTRCWVWTAAKVPQGYGKILGEGPRKMLAAHRASWLLAHGELPPPGIEVCHACDNPPCVNPAHLWLGTRRDNARDCAKKGRTVAQKNPGMFSAVLLRGRDTMVARALARPDPDCIHCGGPARRRWAGRCHTCDMYLRRHGVDRPLSLLNRHCPRCWLAVPGVGPARFCSEVCRVEDRRTRQRIAMRRRRAAALSREART